MPQLITIPSNLPHPTSTAARAMRGDLEIEIMATLARAGHPQTVSEVYQHLSEAGAAVSRRTTERSINLLANTNILRVKHAHGPANIGTEYALNLTAIQQVDRQYMAYITTGLI